jgi:hypothetical protein
MRVVRAQKALEKAHLIKRDRDGWELTERGKREVAPVVTNQPVTGPFHASGCYNPEMQARRGFPRRCNM